MKIYFHSKPTKILLISAIALHVLMVGRAMFLMKGLHEISDKVTGQQARLTSIW